MKLKLRYLSDLHLEFMRPQEIIKFIDSIKPNCEKEICILAGDIGNPYGNPYRLFMNSISNKFKKSFIIPGNHEYYQNNRTIEETNLFLTEYFKSYDNITFLNNSYEQYNDYCFVGTTLWTKITNPNYLINDVNYIKNFNYLKSNQLNMLAIDFLDDTVSKNDNCIIITHHLPSNNLIDIKYKTQRLIPYNQWFYCDIEDFIQEHNKKIKCWIYGHTHTPSYQIMYDIPFVCNPIGYPNENQNIDLNKNIII